MRIDNRALQSALTLLRTQNDECYVRPQEGGWQMWCARPDGATLVNATLSKEAFDSVEDTPEVFVMDIDAWQKAVRTFKESAEVEFLDGRVRLSGAGIRHTFRLNAFPEELGRNVFKVPDLSSRHTAEVMAETDRIRALLNVIDTKRIGDLRVTVNQGGLMLQAYDDMENGVDLTVPPEDCALIDGKARAMFSTESWQEIFKVIPADTAVDIRLGDGMPVTIEFGDKMFWGMWLSAPYIEQE